MLKQTEFSISPPPVQKRPPGSMKSNKSKNLLKQMYQDVEMLICLSPVIVVIVVYL